LLYSRTTGMFSIFSLAIHLVVYFFLTVITSGLAVAGGLFVPMMLIGAIFGRMVGQILQLFVTDTDPSVYALVGTAAMMSGFSRITVSLCVIIIELTENTQFLLPIILTVMVAKWVGDALSHPIYEDKIEVKSIPFLEHHPPLSTYELGVTDIMAREVDCIYMVDKLSRIVDVLTNTRHNGFPVVSKEEDGRERTFRGFITRNHLLILMERRQYSGPGSSPGILDFEYFTTLMNHKWKLSQVQKGLPPRNAQHEYILDVTRYMDLSHLLVPDSFSFLDVYRLFQTQGLRHLTVIDDRFQVVGIITRHDLLSYMFDGDGNHIYQASSIVL